MQNRRFGGVVRLVWMLLALLPVGMVQAQPAAVWQAWLYNGERGVMERIAEDGTPLMSVALPLPPDAARYSDTAAFSQDGLLVAYAVTNAAGDRVWMIVYDIMSDDILVLHEVPGPVMEMPFSYGWHNDLFSPQSPPLVAFSYVLQDGAFRLDLINIETGLLADTLTMVDPRILNAGISQGLFRLPVVRAFDGDRLDFIMLPIGTEGPLTMDSYRWDRTQDTIRATVRFPSLLTDTLPATGETISPAFDERLPNRIDTLMMGVQHNSLHVYDPEIGSRYPFYAAENLSFRVARFIEDGQRVLAGAYDIDASAEIWFVINRDGTLAGYLPIDPVDDRSVHGLPGGFIYTRAATDASGSSRTMLFYVDSAAALSSGRMVWQSAPDDASWTVAWVTRSPRLPAPPPFVRLAPPIGSTVVSPDSVPTVPAQAAQGVLTVGGVAYIQTTEGDRLNVRIGPGTAYERIARAENGTRVTLLEGPRPADGFVWWRVRLPDGTEGWVVQRADNVDTLLPAGG